MPFAANLRQLRRRYGLSQNELAERLGYKSFTTVQKWEDGTSAPPYRVLDQIARLFDVTTEQLMGELSSLGKAPVLGIVRGGEPILAEQNVLDYETLFYDDPAGSDYFYLQVTGDSMKDDRILPGDLLYVHRQPVLENGEIGVVMIDGEATVKRVYQEDGGLVLRPSNEAYQPIVCKKEDLASEKVRILGKVLSNKIRF